MPTSGNLARWAQQGVLLLNATLTVRAHQAGSHQGHGWETFTDAVIRILAEGQKHLVLTSAHPSPLSAYNGFFGNKHFSRTNEYLQEHGEAPIVW